MADSISLINNDSFTSSVNLLHKKHLRYILSAEATCFNAKYLANMA